LTFVIDSNPTATGYQTFRGVYYKLIKQDWSRPILYRI
jgi:hypothetical protein